MRFELPDEKKLYKVGATTVWVNYEQQKSVPLPEWLRALILD